MPYKTNEKKKVKTSKKKQQHKQQLNHKIGGMNRIIDENICPMDERFSKYIDSLNRLGRLKINLHNNNNSIAEKNTHTNKLTKSERL